MATLPFDPADPPDEPPAQVRQLMLWRLAVRLFRDHDPYAAPVPPAPAPPAAGCPVCGHTWPCPARRMAERGLLLALTEPVGGRNVRWFGPQNRPPDR